MLGKFKTHMLVLLQWNKSHLMDIFCAYSIVMNVWQARPFIRQPTLLAFCPEYCCNTICDWLSLYHALLHKGKRPPFLINLRWLAAICLTVSILYVCVGMCGRGGERGWLEYYLGWYHMARLWYCRTSVKCYLVNLNLSLFSTGWY